MQKTAFLGTNSIDLSITELKTALECFKKGQEQASDELVILFEVKGEALDDLLSKFPEMQKVNTTLTLAQIQKMQTLVEEIKLNNPEISQTIEASLKIFEIMPKLLTLVERSPSNYSGSMVAQMIMEEIQSYNKKQITLEELPELKQHVIDLVNLFSIQIFAENNKGFEEVQATANFDQIRLGNIPHTPTLQFLQKIVGYLWKQTVRNICKTIEEDEAKILLKAAPKEMKMTKCWEWNQLCEKVKSVEWLEDKDIKNKLKDILNDKIWENEFTQEFLALESTQEYLESQDKFIEDAFINVQAESLKNRVQVYQEILTEIKSANSTPESVRTIIEKMLEVEFWNTKVFTKFDSVNQVLKQIEYASSQITKKHSSEDEKTLMDLEDGEEAKKDRLPQGFSEEDKLDISVIHLQVEKFEILQDSLQHSFQGHIDVIKSEIDKLKHFIENSLSQLDERIHTLLGEVESSVVEELDTSHSDLQVSYAQFSFASQEFEKKSKFFEELLSAHKQTQDVGRRQNLKIWDKTLNSLKALLTNVDPDITVSSVPLVLKMEVELKKAKAFFKVTQRVKHGADEASLLTIPELNQLIEAYRREEGLILMDESFVYLDGIIAHISDFEMLLSQEKIEFQQLKDGLDFMTNLNLDVKDLMSKYKKKKDRAEEFVAKIQNTKRESLEKDFNMFTEEYGGLGIIIPKIEQRFNDMQSCKNNNIFADRICAKEQNCSLKDLAELRIKVKMQQYFKSNNRLAKVTAAFFYSMREEYEDCPNEREFSIELNQLKDLMNEARILADKCKDNVKADLLEKINNVSHIFKDVSEHLSKNVYTLSTEEFKSNPPSTLFRDFIKIEGQIEEFKLKLEEKERMLEEEKNRKPSIEEKPVLHDKITNQARGFYVKSWADALIKNQSLDLDPSQAKLVSKEIEGSMFKLHQNEPFLYEEQCDEISRILKDICSYIYLSLDIKEQKFSCGSIRALTGKTPADLRKLNYIKKNDSKLQKGENDPTLRNNTSKNQPKNLKQLINKVSSAENKMQYSNVFEFELENDQNHYQQLSAPVQYKYYRIYEGSIKVQDEKSINVNLDQIEMLVCSSRNNISKFGRIPEQLSITTKIDKDGFSKYINRVLNPKVAKEYKILTGWFNIPHGLQNLKEMLDEKKCVGSKQYSKGCKIFMFPVQYLESQWLEQLNVTVMSKEHSMMFMLIWKISEKDDQLITPFLLSVEGKQAYSLKMREGKLKASQITLDKLKENQPGEQQAQNLLKQGVPDKMTQHRVLQSDAVLKNSQHHNHRGGMEYSAEHTSYNAGKKLANTQIKNRLVEEAQSGISKILKKYNFDQPETILNPISNANYAQNSNLHYRAHDSQQIRFKDQGHENPLKVAIKGNQQASTLQQSQFAQGNQKSWNKKNPQAQNMLPLQKNYGVDQKKSKKKNSKDLKFVQGSNQVAELGLQKFQPESSYFGNTQPSQSLLQTLKSQPSNFAKFASQNRDYSHPHQQTTHNHSQRSHGQLINEQDLSQSFHSQDIKYTGAANLFLQKRDPSGSHHTPSSNFPIKKLSKVSSDYSHAFGGDITNIHKGESSLSSLASLTSKFKTQKPNLANFSNCDIDRPFGELSSNSSYLQNAINSITVTGGQSQVGRLAQLIRKDSSSQEYNSGFDTHQNPRRDYENMAPLGQVQNISSLFSNPYVNQAQVKNKLYY